MFGKSVYSVKDTIMIHIASHRFFEPIQSKFSFKRIRFSYSWWPQHWHFILGGVLKSHLTLQDNDFESLLYVATEKKKIVEDGRLLAFFQFHLFRCYINVNVPTITSPLPDFFSDLAKKGGGVLIEWCEMFLVSAFGVSDDSFLHSSSAICGSAPWICSVSAVSGRLWCLWYYKMDNWYTYHKYCT